MSGTREKESLLLMAGGVSLFTLALALYGTIAPAFIAHAGTYNPTFTNTTIKTWVKVGSWVAGSATTDPGNPVFGTNSTVTWGQVAEVACVNTSDRLYLEWAKPNNFCNSEGNFVTPSNIGASQAFTILSVIFIFFQAVLGLRANVLYAKLALCSGCLAIICCIISFSVWNTLTYANNLRSGAVPTIPVLTLEGTIVPIASPNDMSLGPCYAVFVLAFIMISGSTGCIAYAIKLPEGASESEGSQHNHNNYNYQEASSPPLTVSEKESKPKEDPVVAEQAATATAEQDPQQSGAIEKA